MLILLAVRRSLFSAVMSPRRSSSLFLLLVLLNLNLQCVSGGKILVWPAEFSHWLNVKVIIDTLIERGHNITVVTHTATPSVKTTPSEGYNVEILQVPHTKQEILENMERMLKYWTHELPNDNIIKASLKIKEMVDIGTEQNQAVCSQLFAREDLLEKWREEKFDALLADPMFMCGELLAEKLNLPFILSLRFSFGNTLERLCAQLPAPPSYVPSIGSEKTDDMNFLQRLKNVLSYGGQDFVFYLVTKSKWDHFYTEILEYSHWYNMRNIVDELLNRNHSVTVLVNSASPSVNFTAQERFQFLVFDVPLNAHEVHSVSEQLINIWMQYPTPSRVTIGLQIVEFTGKMIEFQRILCDSMLRNDALIARLRDLKFDVLFYDPMFLCSDLLAEILDLPLVLSLRFSLGFSMERMCGQMPSPPSYVPVPPTVMTDHMCFMERVKNMIMYVVYSVGFRMASMRLDNYYSEILGKPTTMCETMGKADIWLIRTYWDFEYPRPLLPNFKFVGGLHCKPAKPLPKELEKFVQSSGDHGIVVFSLGSMINNLTLERSNTIASALGQIPQKVIWRYKGKTPETLAPNTKLYDWIPQNDLLGHPKTKAFITHGGTNGLYEAIYHGVPMVGLPLFADQPDNMMHMKTKGAAVVLDINTMKSKDLAEALKTVLNNPSYKESIMRLSRIHHDQPIKPLDQAVYWIEFVMRNKGAKHLRVQAHELNWFQYHCLDVLAFLISIVALITFLFIKTCSFFFRKCFRKTRPDGKAQKKNKKE
ncbi:UDP-glucuronosyltransferase 2A1-like isoform X4 [Pimephales promelas]|uniref:UDP-glucuronosyltransferase 2A1-like isoform X4 n=2 Tax=Pimephales promelas TaxID=90988 RepID=UPI0019556BA3|nr:UDP-glucuronosyltransferase 2A1-like isoform X4 [Pimephales promelas]